MNHSEKIKTHSFQLKRYIWVLALFWTAVVAASLLWNVVRIKVNIIEAARIKARVAYEKDVIYRRWSTMHGGVYVPMTEKTQPNPYLDIAERDIVTPSGKLLTLMNPAYMTRQMHEIAKDKYGVRGHITSLNPIRPENAPDPWEIKALQAFERGETELSYIEELEGGVYMRLMRPLITEKDCLKCHARQGYRVGDIRGGISVSIPMERLRALSRNQILTLSTAHAILWLLALAGIVSGTHRLGRKERERKRMEEALQKAHDELEQRVKERTAELSMTNEQLKEEIEKRERADRRIQFSLAIEKSLRGIDRMIIQRRPLEEVFQVACQGALDMGYCMAWVGLAEPDHTVRPVAHMGFENDYLRDIRLRWDDTPEGSGATGTAIRTGEPVLRSDRQKDSGLLPWREQALKRGYRSSAAIPLKSDKQVIGVLNVYSTRPDDFGPEQMDSLLGFAQQITVAIFHSRALEELERTRVRLQAIFDHALEGICLVQALPEGGFRYMIANEASKRICGIDITGKTPEECFPPGVAAQISANYRRVIAEGKPITLEEELVFTTGCKYLRRSLILIGDHGMIMTVTEDITEEREKERQFQQIQRLESVGRLAGGVAHDFNNLVTVIIGFADLAALALAKDSPVLKDLEEIKKAAQRATSLTRQLLAFSRRQVLRKEAIGLNEVVAGVEKMLRRVIGEHIEIRTKLTPELDLVMADTGQVEQVIMNLAVNARDAMPGGGKLILETSNVDLDQEYAGKHVGAKPGRYAMLAVSDTGCGMSTEVQERLFEPFFTTKEEGKGTGLGLSTVYGIVKQHGGNIWVYSEVGKGTTFKVYLPVAAEGEKKLPTARPESADLLPRGKETILLVEDQGEVRQVAQRALSQLGYTVMAAASAKEAMELLSSHTGPLHLLVADVVMPGISGLELAREVERVRPQVKVLFISGYSDEAVIDHGLIPADRFLQKPFSPDQIARKVREVLGQ